MKRTDIEYQVGDDVIIAEGANAPAAFTDTGFVSSIGPTCMVIMVNRKWAYRVARDGSESVDRVRVIDHKGVRIDD